MEAVAAAVVVFFLLPAGYSPEVKQGCELQVKTPAPTFASRPGPGRTRSTGVRYATPTPFLLRAGRETLSLSVSLSVESHPFPSHAHTLWKLG